MRGKKEKHETQVKAAVGTDKNPRAAVIQLFSSQKLCLAEEEASQIAQLGTSCQEIRVGAWVPPQDRSS